MGFLRILILSTFFEELRASWYSSEETEIRPFGLFFKGFQQFLLFSGETKGFLLFSRGYQDFLWFFRVTRVI
jgi:hypothetical protein